MPSNQEQALVASDGLIKSSTVVVGNTLISRILGFVRDVVIAHIFGAVGGVDAFIVAFKIPNFMRRLFAEGAFSQAFVPVLSEYYQTNDKQTSAQFVNKIAGTLSVILSATVVIGIFVSPILIMIFAPGFNQEGTRFELAVQMLRITFPYLLFISLTAFSGAILNSNRYFGIPSITPVMLNISLIFAACVLAPYLETPITALAWGVLIAGIAQLLFQIPFLKQRGLLPKPQWGWKDPGVQRVLKLMVPALFGVSVSQINLVIDTLFASFLVTGSVSWLYYSDRLMSFPLGVFGVALATVILPHLSRKHADQSKKEFSQTIDWAIRLILLIAIPSAIGLLMLAGPLMATLFQHGQFGEHDVLMATKSLMAFGIGVPAFMLAKVLASAFYAKQNIKTPVKIAVIAMVTNIILNLILIMPLAHAGLALATSISAVLNASLLIAILLKEKIYQPEKNWWKFLSRLLFANTLMLVFLVWQSPEISIWLNWGWQQKMFELLWLLFGAMATYFSGLLLVGIRPKDFITNP